MPDPNNRHSDNVPGPWYVDDQCIVCGLCDEVLPEVFALSADGDHNFVHHQPDTGTQLALANEAMDSCPVEAIGNDGQPSEICLRVLPIFKVDR